MSSAKRRAGGAAAAIVLLCGAAAGTRALSSARAEARHQELAELAEGSRSRAQDAVHAQLSAVEGRAVAAASNPVLRAQLGVVDAATLRDGFASEPWWEPVRRDFPIYGVAAGGSPEVLVGADSGLDFSTLVKEAREKRQSSAVLASADAAVVAGAAAAEGAGRRARFVVLLAKPLDAVFLDEVASRTRGAAIVSDGKIVLLSAGAAAEQGQLKSAVGKESAALVEGRDWVGAASPLAPNLWLWSFARARAAEKAPVELIALWAAAGLGALIALFLGFRPRPAEAAFRVDGGEPPIRSDPGGRARSDPGGRVRSDPGGRVRSDPGGLPVRSDPSTTSPGKTRTTGPRTDSGVERKPGPVARPKQFGRYYLIDRLGEGGMAEVYTAVAFGAENFRRAFVVKLLHSNAQRSEALVEMFIDEAKLASSLVHSNIIPVYDFGKMGDEYFMAQEYVLGRDLRKLVTTAVKVDHKPLDPRLCVHIAREALRALDYAHNQRTDEGRPMGIVHRDISPNNLLVSARGEVKLFDFGIAKAEEGRLHQTQTGVVKGNVQYMSPEQARGEAVDARADVYSLGLVLYFLAAGRSLYRGESAYELLVQAAQGLTPELAPRLEKLPGQLAAVLRQALVPDREQRFQSAAAFENALSGLPSSGAVELAKEIQRLFGEELKAEQARFASIEPPPEEPPPDEGAAGEEEAH
jgi:predicted Ser/Thr protein kinase